MDLSAVNQRGKDTMVAHLGIEVTEFSEGKIVATMPVDHRTHQPAGLLHGGASVALAETLGSMGSAYIIREQKNKMPVGIEINANHVKSARSGYVIGTAVPIKIGRTIHLWQIEIHNEKKELVCTSRLTVMIVDRT